MGVSCSKDIESSENEQICEKKEYNDENVALDCSPWISMSWKCVGAKTVFFEGSQGD
jgi:hypothetical protein